MNVTSQPSQNSTHPVIRSGLQSGSNSEDFSNIDHASSWSVTALPGLPLFVSRSGDDQRNFGCHMKVVELHRSLHDLTENSGPTNLIQLPGLSAWKRYELFSFRSIYGHPVGLTSFVVLVNMLHTYDVEA